MNSHKPKLCVVYATKVKRRCICAVLKDASNHNDLCKKCGKYTHSSNDDSDDDDEDEKSKCDHSFDVNAS